MKSKNKIKLKLLQSWPQSKLLLFNKVAQQHIYLIDLIIKFLQVDSRLQMAETPKNLYFTPPKHSKIQKETMIYSTASSQKESTKDKESPAKCNAFDLQNQTTVFSPFSEKFYSEDNKLNDKISVTDRYIPSRKLLKKDSLYQHEHENDNIENQGAKNEATNVKVSDLYKRYVMSNMCKTTKENQEKAIIESYQNTNILKYMSNTNEMNVSLLTRNSNLEFTDELCSANILKRKIQKLPVKVLDAPALQDDYYLNLIDWSCQNLLAVGLGSSVYLWNASNSKVNKLCDLGTSDSVTSVSWALKGSHFAIGANSGEVHIWDTEKMKKVRVLEGHLNRVGAMSWNSSLLSSGSRDKTILNRDVRENKNYVNKLVGHKQEVCGLKWSPDEQQLCSGGNDNKLLVWNSFSSEPIIKFTDHMAAVKAMAWSPHQHGLLVSGGGTADRTIRFRNTLLGTTTKIVDVGSQVCNLTFSKSLNQLVSTHGYSHHQINIWKSPQMKKICTLTGHTYRVLYLAMNPDGTTIVTGAGDETLRFWNIFPTKSQTEEKTSSFLNTEGLMLR